MAYGWFVPTYLLGIDMEKIEKLCADIDQNPPQSEDERRVVEARIHTVMLGIVFHPNFRARGVWHGVKLKHFRSYSHIYEMAIFAYYKREYAACILLLLCALEGILRSYSGLANPKFHELVASIRDAPPRHIPEAHAMYGAILADFLEQWIYRRTKDADFSLSVLNRHYVMHGQSGEFYRPQDAHRLILLFDLLIDFLSVDTNFHHGVFLPSEGEDTFFDKRRDYYTSLSEGDQTVKQTWKTERALLSDHPEYNAPSVDEPDILKSQVLGLLDMLAIRSKIDG